MLWFVFNMKTEREHYPKVTIRKPPDIKPDLSRESLLVTKCNNILIQHALSIEGL